VGVALGGRWVGRGVEDGSAVELGSGVGLGDWVAAGSEVAPRLAGRAGAQALAKHKLAKPKSRMIIAQKRANPMRLFAYS
jgi:hypothetical protein